MITKTKTNSSRKKQNRTLKKLFKKKLTKKQAGGSGRVVVKSLNQLLKEKEAATAAAVAAEPEEPEETNGSYPPANTNISTPTHTPANTNISTPTHTPANTNISTPTHTPIPIHRRGPVTPRGVLTRAQAASSFESISKPITKVVFSYERKPLLENVFINLLRDNFRDPNLLKYDGKNFYESIDYKKLINNLYFSEAAANNNKSDEHPEMSKEKIYKLTRTNILHAFKIVYNLIKSGSILNIASIASIQSIYFFDVANLCEGKDNFNKVNKIISDINNIQTYSSAKFGNSLFILILHGKYSITGIPRSQNPNIIIIDSQCNGSTGEADDFILYTLFEYFIQFKHNIRRENMFVVSNDKAEWKHTSTALRGVPQFSGNVLIDIIQKTTPDIKAHAFNYIGV